MNHTATLFAATLVLLTGSVLAQPAAPAAPGAASPQGLLSLSASASTEVTQDVLSVVLATTRDGSDAASVQKQLTQALDEALATAKAAVQPGQLDVHTGNFSLYPRYANQPEGRSLIVGWQGTAELVLEGRDMKAISELTGRISSLSVARVSYALSREARERVESELAAEAIERYRAKAAAYARGFGYAGYTIGEVQVSSSEPPPVPMFRAKAMGVAEAALPVEAGKGQVSVNVSGTVQMKAR